MNRNSKGNLDHLNLTSLYPFPFFLNGLSVICYQSGLVCNSDIGPEVSASTALSNIKPLLKVARPAPYESLVGVEFLEAKLDGVSIDNSEWHAIPLAR
jgi:hypothetical protein